MRHDHDLDCVKGPRQQISKGTPAEMFFVAIVENVYFIIELLNFRFVFRGGRELKAEFPNPPYDCGHHALLLDFEEEHHYDKAHERNAGKAPFNGSIFGGQSESRHGGPHCNEGGLCDGLGSLGADCRRGRCEARDSRAF